MDIAWHDSEVQTYLVKQDSVYRFPHILSIALEKKASSRLINTSKLFLPKIW